MDFICGKLKIGIGYGGYGHIFKTSPPPGISPSTVLHPFHTFQLLSSLPPLPFLFLPYLTLPLSPFFFSHQIAPFFSFKM